MQHISRVNTRLSQLLSMTKELSMRWKWRAPPTVHWQMKVWVKLERSENATIRTITGDTSCLPRVGDCKLHSYVTLPADTKLIYHTWFTWTMLWKKMTHVNRKILLYKFYTKHFHKFILDLLFLEVDVKLSMMI